jgi:uncharacterized protein with FMN-binding domain
MMTNGARTINNKQNDLKQKIAFYVRKFCVSAFVVFSFAAYVVHERTTNLNGVADDLPTAATALVATNTPPAQAPAVIVITQVPPASVSNVNGGNSNLQPAPTQAALVTATPRPAATTAPAASTSGQYKDGTYTGSLANARYGMVQVQATIQSGKITDVQFLQYPSDRRTSQRINQAAAPRLTQEAIQAQSAKVSIVSGATLTSRAFMESLQAALTSAKA